MEQVVDALELTSVSDVVDRLIAMIFASRGADRQERLRSEHARMQTDYLLAADDLEDLAARADVLAGDVELWDFEILPCVTAYYRAGADAQKRAYDRATIASALGDAPAALCVQAFEKLDELGPKVQSAIDELRGFLAGAFPKLAAEPPPMAPPQVVPGVPSLLYDAKLPMIMRKALWAYLRFFGVALTIARAEDTGRSLAPWLALGLATACAELPRQISVFLSIPNPAWAAFAFGIVDSATTRRLDAALSLFEGEAAKKHLGLIFPFADDRHEGR
jgi:hypothetical protein